MRATIEKPITKELTWDEVEKELFTTEEIAESNLLVALACELINARNDKGLSQTQIAEMCGVEQSVISRIIKGSTTPQLGTILKVLTAFGKTLAVVPLEEVKEIKKAS